MSAFAPMTAALLARKGEARPIDSEGLARGSVARREPDAYFNASNAATKLTIASVTANPQILPAPDVSFARYQPAPAAGRSHRISLTLTEAEFEKLGIVGVKKGINRQRLLRLAVDFYLEKLAKEYRSECDCISSTECCGAKAG